jgi:hypothetical protein
VQDLHELHVQHCFVPREVNTRSTQTVCVAMFCNEKDQRKIYTNSVCGDVLYRERSVQDLHELRARQCLYRERSVQDLLSTARAETAQFAKSAYVTVAQECG